LRARLQSSQPVTAWPALAIRGRLKIFRIPRVIPRWRSFFFHQREVVKNKIRLALLLTLS